MNRLGMKGAQVFGSVAMTNEEVFSGGKLPVLIKLIFG
jgi:hypothetical protein